MRFVRTDGDRGARPSPPVFLLASRARSRVPTPKRLASRIRVGLRSFFLSDLLSPSTRSRKASGGPGSERPHQIVQAESAQAISERGGFVGGTEATRECQRPLTVGSSRAGNAPHFSVLSVSNRVDTSLSPGHHPHTSNERTKRRADFMVLSKVVVEVPPSLLRFAFSD